MSLTEKPEYIFVFEDKMGGVAYLNKNLINFTSLRNDVFIKVILMDQVNSDHPRFTDQVLADEIIRFSYSSLENKYAVLKRFHHLLGNRPGAIICNEALEMQAIYEYGTNKTVYQVMHDFYNLRLAVKYGAITDVFMAHTQLFTNVLRSADPVATQAFYLPHGVQIPRIEFTDSPADRLRIVFTGRLVEGKGVQDLFDIHQLLIRKGITARWTIIGRGPLKSFLGEQWKGDPNILFAAPDTSEEVIELVGQHDLFVLPTRFEGSPVSILEALSAGVVPVVSDLPGGITEILNQQIGRRIPVGNNELFAEAIADLYHHPELLNQLKRNARKLAEEELDIRKTSDNYFKLFARFGDLKKKPVPLPRLKADFMLDKKWLPNALVKLIRKTLR